MHHSIVKWRVQGTYSPSPRRLPEAEVGRVGGGGAEHKEAVAQRFDIEQPFGHDVLSRLSSVCGPPKKATERRID